jgi:serine/threonine protein kinase
MAVQRFLIEAKAIAALNHPNIVQIYDYGRAQDGPFLIMEYVDGGSLLDRCRQGPIPLDEAVDLACHICDGLAKAHDAAIIHRDIKPANILLTKDGVPKLTDFGLAKAQTGNHGHTVTGTGAVMGTPDFMPPEQRQDAALVDHRSDLWSLAATVYQMVTGRSPKIIRFNDVPAALQLIMAKALEDEREARYQSAKELREALRGVQGGARKRGMPAHVKAVHQEGECAACGMVNEPTRKFCRNPECGVALRSPCLKCEKQIPVWEAICGECGANQPKLIAGMRADLDAVRAAAERNLAELAFDEAIRNATTMAQRDAVR